MNGSGFEDHSQEELGGRIAVSEQFLFETVRIDGVD